MMRALGLPVIFDVTHSLQLPGGGDGVTAGLARVHRAAGLGRRGRRRRRRVPGGARRAARAPRATRRTRSRSIALEPLLRRLVRIDAIVKEA